MCATRKDDGKKSMDSPADRSLRPPGTRSNKLERPFGQAWLKAEIGTAAYGRNRCGSIVDRFVRDLCCLPAKNMPS